MPSPTQQRGSSKIVIASVVILATIGYLTYSGISENKSYYVTISEMQKMGDVAHKRHLRVAGNVAPGQHPAQRHERALRSAGAGQAPRSFVPRLRAATGHLQGRRAGAGHRHLRSRRRLPRHAASGQVRQQVRPCGPGATPPGAPEAKPTTTASLN